MLRWHETAGGERGPHAACKSDFSFLFFDFNLRGEPDVEELMTSLIEQKVGPAFSNLLNRSIETQNHQIHRHVTLNESDLYLCGFRGNRVQVVHRCGGSVGGQSEVSRRSVGQCSAGVDSPVWTFPTSRTPSSSKQTDTNPLLFCANSKTTRCILFFIDVMFIRHSRWKRAFRRAETGCVCF